MRLIAAGLRESGLRAAAKTTGSKPVFIDPDGVETEFARTGTASIREQARVVRRAAAAGADVLVAEMMSIGSDCLGAESRGILRPGLLALTNVRLDHVEAMGRTRDEIARTLTAAFPRRARIFVPAEENREVFVEAAARLGSSLEAVPEEVGTGGGASLGSGTFAYFEFESNVRLALAVCQAAGVEKDTALRGMQRAAPDFGSLRLFTLEASAPARRVVCVNAFAANDPESSADVLRLVATKMPLDGVSVIGLLNLRDDRGDRTLQWVKAAAAGFFRDFERVVLIGPPAPAALRKIRKMAPRQSGDAAGGVDGRPEVRSRRGEEGRERPGRGNLSPAQGFSAEQFVTVRENDPAKLMARIARMTRDAARDPVVIGLGNIGGHGGRIVEHWMEAGGPHGR